MQNLNIYVISDHVHTQTELQHWTEYLEIIKYSKSTCPIE